jgi:tRNA(Ser,Leu) C12 N-acetylase TAN1
MRYNLKRRGDAFFHCMRDNVQVGADMRKAMNKQINRDTD